MLDLENTEHLDGIQEPSITASKESTDLPYPTGLYTQYPADMLRRDFIAECCDHVSRLAANSAYAITKGDDRLFLTQIELMRTTMREVMRTHAEMVAEAKR
jgi:hypothetical protein